MIGNSGLYLADSKMLFYNSDNKQSNEFIYDHNAQFPPETFQQDIQKDDMLELEMVQFSCEQSYYNVSSSRNSIFNYSSNGGANYYLCTMADGNYDITEMKTVIKTALDAASVLAGNVLVWTVAINQNTMKYTFTYTGTPTSTIKFQEYSTLKGFDLLGFTSGAVKTITSGTVSDIQASIGNISDMYIHCDITNSYHVAGATSLDSVFASVPITTPFFGYIIWEKNSDFSPRLRFPVRGEGNLNRLHLSLRDKYDNFIVVTKDFTMTLRLNIYRPKSRDLEKLLALGLMDS